VKVPSVNMVAPSTQTPSQGHHPLARPQTVEHILAWPLIVTASVVILWSRLGGLSLGMWHDEIYTTVTYVKPGPSAVFFGDYVPNNHMLFSLLAWTVTATFGTSEVTLRLWSVIPALLILGLAVRWLWRTAGLSSAAVFLVLVLAHPVLMIISNQARGYGPAMFFVALTIGACWYALSESPPSRALGWVGAAATLAIFTNPATLIPFLALIPLLWIRYRFAAIRLAAVVGVLSFLWYLGNLVDLVHSVNQEYGEVLPWYGPLTGPFRYGLYSIVRFVASGKASESSSALLTTLPSVAAFIVGAFLVVLGIRRFARVGSPLQAATLWVPVFGTYFVLTAARVWVMDRFVSFLFLPFLALLAAGIVEAAAGALAIVRDERISSWARVLVGVMGLILGLVVIARTVPEVDLRMTRPREALKDVGALVNDLDGPVLTNSRRSFGLDYYIDRPLEVLSNEELEARVCNPTEGPVVVIDHPLLQERALDTSCLEQMGLHRERFLQLIRGGWIDVWASREDERPSAPG
jgi:hypothetical protein